MCKNILDVFNLKNTHLYSIHTQTMIVWKSDILYSTDKKGSQKQWVVEVHDLGGESYGVRRTFGQVGGKMQTSEKIVKSGKNIGKANETTPRDQAILEAKALFKKKQPDDKILPMLAGTWTPKSKLSSKVYVQPKLDGIRLMLGRRDGEIVMMTRTGKPVTGMEQALNDPAAKKLQEGEWVDGEAYSKDIPFEEISGKFRKNSSCPELEFHVFDTFDLNNISESFEKRCYKIARWKHTVPTALIDPSRIEEFHDKFVAEGYEGIIIREPHSAYEIGYRSKNLLKFKKFDTNEFRIVGCEEGTAKDAGTAIFVCECAGGKFNVRPKGTLATRKEYWENRSKYMGQMLTVKHQDVSVEGIPRFPVGLAVRNYE